MPVFLFGISLFDCKGAKDAETDDSSPLHVLSLPTSPSSCQCLRCLFGSFSLGSPATNFAVRDAVGGGFTGRCMESLSKCFALMQGAATISDVLANALLGLLCAASVAALSVRLRALTPSGAIATTAVGTAVFAAGGVRWAAILILFFVSSSALSRLQEGSDKPAKTGARDGMQVVANGGFPAIYALCFIWHASPLWTAGFAGAVAVATADTWATEIGARSRTPPVRITTGQPLDPGTSGGVTLLGTFASLLGSSAIAIAGRIILQASNATMTSIALAGLLGSLVDSTLGATLQELRRCPECLVVTEQRIHRACGTPTEVIRGWHGFDNDAVNMAACGIGSLITMLLAATTGAR